MLGVLPRSSFYKEHDIACALVYNRVADADYIKGMREFE
jgi:hypothetical protein